VLERWNTREESFGSPLRLFGAAGVLLMAAAAGPVWGQSPTWSSVNRDASGAVRYEVHYRFDPQPFDVPAVPRAPYSATEVSIAPVTNADGAIERQEEETRRIFRDGEGRVRVERWLRIGPGVAEKVPLVEITDYAAGFHYTLDLQNKIAYRTIRPAVVTIGSPAAREVLPSSTASIDSNGSVRVQGSATTGRSLAGDEPPGRQAITVNLPPGQAKPLGPDLDRLGTQVIEGVQAVGEGFTRTIASNSGPNAPQITIHSEKWISPELRVTVLSKVSDATNGERIVKLTNIRRGEPDPKLFQAPLDYKVQDEKQGFEIQFVVNR
jgi:hypothetical protein